MQTNRRNLVLGRKAGESIEIGEVTVYVVEIRGDIVRLAIKAAASVPILRSELKDVPPPKRVGQ